MTHGATLLLVIVPAVSVAVAWHKLHCVACMHVQPESWAGLCLRARAHVPTRNPQWLPVRVRRRRSPYLAVMGFQASRAPPPRLSALNMPSNPFGAVNRWGAASSPPLRSTLEGNKKTTRHNMPSRHYVRVLAAYVRGTLASLVVLTSLAPMRLKTSSAFFCSSELSVCTAIRMLPPLILPS